MPTLYNVYQDGAVFYATVTPKPYDAFSDNPAEMRTWTASIKVPDFDMDAAEKARVEFITFCQQHGITLIWEKDME